MNQTNTPDEESSWPDYGYQINVGSYGGVDDRYTRRTRKHPLGFTTQPAKTTPRRRTK